MSRNRLVEAATCCCCETCTLAGRIGFAQCFTEWSCHQHNTSFPEDDQNIFATAYWQSDLSNPGLCSYPGYSTGSSRPRCGAILGWLRQAGSGTRRHQELVVSSSCQDTATRLSRTREAFRQTATGDIISPRRMGVAAGSSMLRQHRTPR